MSDKEIAALDAKLAQIWGVLCGASIGHWENNETWRTYTCWLNGNEFVLRVGRTSCYAVFNQGMERAEGGVKIYVNFFTGMVRCSDSQFGEEWLTIVRRNCFLCGANIEVSAHEKLEKFELSYHVRPVIKNSGSDIGIGSNAQSKCDPIGSAPLETITLFLRIPHLLEFGCEHISFLRGHRGFRASFT